ncbi:hypothetical protein SK128_005367 [Halocaridina rubra]|uniref:Thyroglobulin type-1 domain-containing protein n=1 Tax=Halocaridina rubra TaxID=373956 RepID=A0AAN8X542_HALRR
MLSQRNICTGALFHTIILAVIAGATNSSVSRVWKDSRMKLVTSFLTLQFFLLLTQGYDQLFSDDNHGINTLNYLLDNEVETFCHYVTCQENTSRDKCPDGTRYMEDVAQFGCCGACVRFLQVGEGTCTGSIDPKYGGGYTRNSETFEDSLSTSGNITLLLPDYEDTLYSSWCDYYYVCGTSSAKCETNPADTGCKYVQNSYDEDLVDPNAYLNYRDDYRWRPDCAIDGSYAEKQCKGPLHEKRCVCVDPQGNRLYGSAMEYQTERYKSMNCKCSRQVWERQQAGESTVTLHCAENGNYEHLQCEKGWCYCINPETAEPYGPNLPESAMQLLPCYNGTYVGQQYLRRCESEYFAHATLRDLMAYKNVQGPSTRLKCDPDGSYNAIQCDNTM